MTSPMHVPRSGLRREGGTFPPWSMLPSFSWFAGASLKLFLNVSSPVRSLLTLSGGAQGSAIVTGGRGCGVQFPSQTPRQLV